jgi:transposase-like protein
LPTNDAASTLIWLARGNITAAWSHTAHHWKEAMNQFAILSDNRFHAAA